MICRYDREARDYLLPDGQPCRVDDYGDPTQHCQSRRSCSQHVGYEELTCARCLGRTRRVIGTIVDLSALMMPAALTAGVESQAAVLAGPGADYETFSARRAIARRWILDNVPPRNVERAMGALLDDDDEQHPYVVLTRWAAMISEDYGHERPARWTIANAAAYLDRQLARIAQDPEQDWRLLSDELRRCRDHLEAVLRNDHRSDRGAPCPTCVAQSETGKGPRLRREYGHWCERDDCERMHYDDDSGDVWRCPANRDHWWSEYDYRLRIADVYADAVAAQA